jgi:hypothetical protein
VQSAQVGQHVIWHVEGEAVSELIFLFVCTLCQTRESRVYLFHLAGALFSFLIRAIASFVRMPASGFEWLADDDTAAGLLFSNMIQHVRTARLCKHVESKPCAQATDLLEHDASKQSGSGGLARSGKGPLSEWVGFSVVHCTLSPPLWMQHMCWSITAGAEMRSVTYQIMACFRKAFLISSSVAVTCEQQV